MNLSKKDNEWLSSSKIKWYLKILKWEYKGKLKYILDKFSDFELVKAKEVFNAEIKGILVDIDDCMAPAYWDLLDENSQIGISLLEEWIQLWVLSNWVRVRERVQHLLDKWAILCETIKSKPDEAAFLEACNILWLLSEEVIMIWDDISKDWWALQVLLWYIPVKPIWNSYKNIAIKKWINFFFKKRSRKLANYRNGL